MPVSSELSYIDQPSAFHGLSDGQVALAKQLEDAADANIKSLLEKLGTTGISRYTHVIKARNLAQKQHGIVVKHLMDERDMESGGWYFYKGDKLMLKLCHPHIENGRILMKVQEYL